MKDVSKKYPAQDQVVMRTGRFPTLTGRQLVATAIWGTSL